MTLFTRLSVVWSRCRALVAGRRLDREFDDELQAHLDMLTDEHIRRGMTSDAARRAALLRFGGLVQLTEQHQESQAFAWPDTIRQDLRYAWRTLRRSPTFTLVSVVTLAIGIGVNATVFTLYDAVALRGLPVSDPDRVVRLIRSFQGGGRGDAQYAFSYAEYIAYRDTSRTVSGVVAASWPIRVAHGSETLDGQLVSGNYFSALGISASVGRVLAANDVGTNQPIVVLSARAWRDRFTGDPAIVGKTIRLNDTLFTVVGIAPSDFIGTGNPPRVPDFWAPSTLQPQLLPGSDWLPTGVRRFQLLAHLSPDASESSARAELTLIVSARETETGAGRTIDVLPEHATLFGGVRDPRFRAFVILVMAVVGLILLIACANLSNMSLARAASRQQEFSIRRALGASRARLMRQLLTESGLLAAAGGAAGLVFSAWGRAALWTATAPTLAGVLGMPLPPALGLALDARVLTYTVIASILAALAFGLAPAVQFSRSGSIGAIDGQVSRSRLRQLLIAGQVAVTLALLAASGLLARGAIRSVSVDPGFAVKELFGVAFSRGTDRDRALALQERVFDRLQAADAVAGVTLVERVPLSSTWSTAIVAPRSHAVLGYTLANFVSASYFETVGVPMERGRGFRPQEPDGAAIVSAATARQLWPNADPIGRRFRLAIGPRSAADLHDFEVVGVAHDVRTSNVSRIDPMQVYLACRPATQYGILVRTRGPRAEALEAIRAAVAGVDRTIVPSLQLVSLERLLHDQQGLTNTLAWGASGLALLALLLASIGIHGVMNFLVSRRVREIGVRMALGAGRADVVRLTLRDGMRPVVLGGAVGLLFALGLSSVLRAVLVAPAAPDLLFGVGAFDPATFAVVSAVLTGTSVVACLGPARRATRVDPMTALRVE